RTINPELWKVAEKVFEDKEERTIDHSISKRRTGNRVLQIRAVVKPLTLIDDRFVIIFATDESEATRMESARRDFVANVSHELKTPVGGIALLAEALLDWLMILTTWIISEPACKKRPTAWRIWSMNLSRCRNYRAPKHCLSWNQSLLMPSSMKPSCATSSQPKPMKFRSPAA